MIRMMVMTGMGAIVFIADVAVDDGDHYFLFSRKFVRTE